MRKFTRLEANKEVRRILNRHGVDLSYCQYSVGGMDIRLTGWLCRPDHQEFNGSQIEGLIQDFMRVLPGFTISGDFDNWHFTSDHISYLGDRKATNCGYEDEVERYEIDIDYDKEAS